MDMQTPRHEQVPLKIGVMARSLGLRHGGVYRYVWNVLAHLDRKIAEDGGLEVAILHNESHLRGQFPHCREVYIPLSHTYGHRLVFDYLSSVYHLQALQPDYVIYPKNIIPLSHFILSAKKIPVIHDLGHFEKGLHAYRMWDTLYTKALLNPTCRRAYKIVTVSHSTKNAIIHQFHIQPEKIQAIHSGIAPTFTKRARNESVIQKFQLRLPYIFYNGSITPRKNVMRMLEAFQAVKDQIPHTLYITGSLKWGAADTIHTYIHDTLADRAVILGYVEEEELIALYNLADLFLYPSLHEGFGFPILEAQACGCPVLTSNVTACPEIAGQGAHIVDPYSVEAIKTGILKLVHEKAYTQRLIQRGFENITRFNWQKTAEELLYVCE